MTQDVKNHQEKSSFPIPELVHGKKGNYEQHMIHAMKIQNMLKTEFRIYQKGRHSYITSGNDYRVNTKIRIKFLHFYERWT
jgi:hypothetical protein